ncbi:hypothetical protein JCM10908_006610 [Rhodotorula pacifica]|uniref:uncharacterized protein n=1 Tax=Rhodotorula pacifica TaxID=1495444 RepID=UPI00316FAD7A
MPRSEHRRDSTLQSQVTHIATIAEERTRYLEHDALAKAEREAAATKDALDAWQMTVTAPDFLQRVSSMTGNPIRKTLDSLEWQVVRLQLFPPFKGPVEDLLKGLPATRRAPRVDLKTFEDHVNRIAERGNERIDSVLAETQDEIRKKAERRRGQLAEWQRVIVTPGYEILYDKKHETASQQFDVLAGLVRKMELSGLFQWPISALFRKDPLGVGHKKARANQAQPPQAREPTSESATQPLLNVRWNPPNATTMVGYAAMQAGQLAARHAKPLLGFRELSSTAPYITAGQSLHQGPHWSFERDTAPAPAPPQQFFPLPRAAFFDETLSQHHLPAPESGGSLPLLGGYSQAMPYPQVFAPPAGSTHPLAFGNDPATTFGAADLPQGAAHYPRQQQYEHNHFDYAIPDSQQYGFPSHQAYQLDAVPAEQDHLLQHDPNAQLSHSLPTDGPWQQYMPWQSQHPQ